MKNIIIIIICFLGLTCLCFVPKNDESIPSIQPQVQIAFDENSKEIFFDFLWAFCTDTQFQISRIKFPLEYSHYDENYENFDTTYVIKKDWEFVPFYFNPKTDCFGQVYDNFEHVLRDTDERVFAWHGIGCGIKDFYFFKRQNGKWFLIKREDLST